MAISPGQSPGYCLIFALTQRAAFRELTGTLILALFSDFVKKVRWEGLFRLSNTYRFSIGVFHVCALAFAAQDALRFG
jgi:hypothetical protein